MSVFKEEIETKRVIFNVRLDLAQRLELAKKDARRLGKKLDVESTVDRALEKFLKKAEKKIEDMKRKKGWVDELIIGEPTENDDNEGECEEEEETS